MNVRYAGSYIDKLYADQDALGLYQVIETVGAERPLSDEFWLFCRLLEWVGSTRSGVWQYYETLPVHTFERMSQALEKFGMAEAAEKYRFGERARIESDRTAGLDTWIDSNEQWLLNVAFKLIADHKEDLRNSR